MLNTLAPPSGAKPAQKRDAIKVMLVDDAVVVRGLIGRWVEDEGDMTVVASHSSAKSALTEVKRLNPDVLILDIEMPGMDGITALPLFLAEKRDLIIIMASTLTLRNADISLRALSLGAADYIPKPDGNSALSTSKTFRTDLIEKIRQIAGKRRRSTFRIDQRGAAPAPAAPSLTGRMPLASGRVSLAPGQPTPAAATPGFRLRPFSHAIPKVLVIGSSTGGPQALNVVMKGIAALAPRIPILITQHMPPTFTTILAEHVGRAAGCPAKEADNGDIIKAGHIYVARGGLHMVLRKDNGQAVVVLEDSPPVNFCKPAVDPLFTSAAAIWGSSLMGLVLTGMGSDGARGAHDIVNGGGSVMAQDEATSVVWGMPGATANAGVCSAVLPLEQIAPKLVRVFAGDKS